MKHLRWILLAFFALAIALLPAKESYAKTTISNKKITMAREETKKIYLKGLSAKQLKKVKWSSSNSKVVHVSKKGVLWARKSGKAIITARYKGKKYKCKVTVSSKRKMECYVCDGSGRCQDCNGRGCEYCVLGECYMCDGKGYLIR